MNNPINWRCKMLRALVYGLSLCAVTGALAQDESPSAPPEAATSTQTVSPKQPAAQQTGANTDPNYTPSEEISEDLSVSFPVDI